MDKIQKLARYEYPFEEVRFNDFVDKINEIIEVVNRVYGSEVNKKDE